MKSDPIPHIPAGYQYQVPRETYPSRISSVDNDLEGLERMSRQNQYSADPRDAMVYSAVFKNENKSKYSGPALVNIVEGEVVGQNTMPSIFNPSPEIKNAEMELDKYVRAMNQKADILVQLRKDEAYSEIETQNKYFREYTGKVNLWTSRLEQFKKDAPAKIQKSIDEIKLFEQRLEDAKMEVVKQLEAARELMKSYEVSAKS